MGISGLKMEPVFGAQILSKTTMAFDEEMARSKLLADHRLRAEIRPLSVSGAFEIKTGAILVHLNVKDHPIPNELLDRGNELQDRGRAEAIEHESFASVGLVTWPEDHPGKLLYIITLCQVIDTLLEVLNASAVLWNGSQALVPASQFKAGTRRWIADPVDVPLLMLLRIISHERQMSGGRFGRGLCTLGLQPIIGREIEFPPQDVSATVLTEGFKFVVRWIVLQGIAFEDGDTCGDPNGIVIRLSCRDFGSMIPAPVVLCEIERSILQ